MQEIRNAGGWILVSERLPEPKKKAYGRQQRECVIACQRNGVVKEMLFEFRTKSFWEYGDESPISHWKEDETEKGENEYDVIAWMPLPEPYH